MRCEALAAVAKDSWQKLLIIPCAYPTNRITSIISCFWQTTLENQLTIFIRQPALSPSVQDFPCSNVAYIFFLKYIRKNLRTSLIEVLPKHVRTIWPFSQHISVSGNICFLFPMPWQRRESISFWSCLVEFIRNFTNHTIGTIFILFLTRICQI